MKQVKSFVGLMLILICALLPTIHVFAEDDEESNGVNRYNDTDYKSEEELNELEEILKKDGYVCITEICTENAEWTKALANNVFFKYYEYVRSLTDKVYVKPEDVEYFLGGKSEMSVKPLNASTVVCAYYEYVTTEMGSFTGKTGNEIPMGVPVGTIAITANVDKSLTEKFENGEASRLEAPNATVVLFGKNTDAYYVLNLDYINNYSVATTIPEDIYYISSAVIDGNLTAIWNDIYDNGIEVQENGGVGIEISFVRPQDLSDSGIKQGVNNVNLRNMEVTAPQIMTVEREEKKFPFGIVITCVVVLAAVGGIAAFAKYKRDSFEE